MRISSHHYGNGSTSTSAIELTSVPDKCPLCNHAASLIAHQAYSTRERYGEEEAVQVVFQCPRVQCRRISVGYYAATSVSYSEAELKYVLPKNIEPNNFSEEIKNISSEFVAIYAQAERAENDGMDKIAGVGYRKALEFLIKDYAIAENPTKKTEIEKKTLSSAISEDVNDQRIKNVSTRAAWLGNDETHYTRKWTDRDIQDLKSLIQLSVHWIESEALTKKLVQDMPAGGPTVA